MDFTNPGSQAKEGSFFGLEAALEGLEPGFVSMLYIFIYIPWKVSNVASLV